jgi:hypothetical protein
MGIHKLLPNLPGGNTVTDTKYGRQNLNVEEFAAAVATSGKVNQSWQGDIEKEVLEISQCYLGAKYYDKERNVRRLDHFRTTEKSCML